MNYKQFYGKTIQESFENFNNSNPHVFEAIEKEAWRAVSNGKKKFSVKSIVNYVRWNYFMTTKDADSEFKINDAFTSRYARMLISKHPEMGRMIELRNLRS